jgi:hypothetical protein
MPAPSCHLISRSSRLRLAALDKAGPHLIGLLAIIGRYHRLASRRGRHARRPSQVWLADIAAVCSSLALVGVACGNSASSRRPDVNE